MLHSKSSWDAGCTGLAERGEIKGGFVDVRLHELIIHTWYSRGTFGCTRTTAVVSHNKIADKVFSLKQ